MLSFKRQVGDNGIHSGLGLHLKDFVVTKYQCAENNSTFNKVEQRVIVSK